MMNFGFVVASLFGLILGLSMAWMSSAWCKHRDLKNQFPNKRLPISLLISRILSVLFGMVLPLVSSVILLRYWPSLLNVAIYICTTVGSAFGAWRYIFKASGSRTDKAKEDWA